MDFLLDPHVIAVPNSIASADELTAYIDTLKRWLLASGMKNHKLWFTSYMTKTLHKENLFPYPSIIKSRYSSDLSQKHKQDLQTIVQVIQGRLMQPPHLDKHLNLPEPDLDLIDSIVLPGEIEKRLSSDVAHALKKSFVAMGIESVKNNSDEVRNMFFATNPLGTANQVEIDINQLDDGAIIERINATWSMLTHPDQLDEVEGLLNFWRETQRALNWKFNQLQACGALIKGMKCPMPKVGLHFNQSIEANKPIKNLGLVETTFRNTILALMEISGFERHIHARGESGKMNKHHRLLNDGEHITRQDGSTAWRVHLCGNHRLHYWLLPDGSAELSVVTSDQHNDFYIA
jgi:hypothetical protein